MHYWKVDVINSVFVFTIIAGVAKDLCDIFVGWVLSQGTHDVCNLIEGYFGVTNSVKKSEGLSVV